MPCWFYDKKDLVNTPSFRDGINAETEAYYRKEGAKHIIEAGNKLGLRFDTCATGVVYFHRFYMFHSFKEFHRLVTAACCLFLAGKVEETPKKCKDIIKTFRSMLNDAQFAHFGEDPKEEVMTLERILLQTIKFDLMVEHPYAYLLKFAKLVKGDKAKIQKMVQMAWTFINDSLCTTLCLQWEPEIIAVAVMYLTSRLNKFDIIDWQGKPSGFRGKWYEFLVEDITLELLEDICHQVLDLYAKAPQPQKEESPAVPRQRPPPTSSDDDQSRSTPRTPKSPSVVKKPLTSAAAPAGAAPAGVVPMESDTSAPSSQRESPNFARAVGPVDRPVGGSQSIPQGAGQSAAAAAAAASAYSTANPYMSTQMYSSSFMSTEGSQSIQSLIGVQGQNQPSGAGQQYSTTPTYQAQAAAAAGYAAVQQRSQPPAASGMAASSGYRAASASQYPGGGVYAAQQYTSYQPPAQAASSGYGQVYPQMSGNAGNQFGSLPTTPVSSTYQSYATSGPTYSSTVNPGSQQRYPPGQQAAAGYQGQSSAQGYPPAQQQGGYPGQVSAAAPGYQGQNSGYPQQGQHRSNNRRDNRY